MQSSVSDEEQPAPKYKSFTYTDSPHSSYEICLTKEEEEHFNALKQGIVDVAGRDSFENILKKIQETLSTAPHKNTDAGEHHPQRTETDDKTTEVNHQYDEKTLTIIYIVIVYALSMFVYWL